MKTSPKTSAPSPYKLFPPTEVFRAVIDRPVDEVELWTKPRIVAQGRNYETGAPMLDHLAHLVSLHYHRPALFYALQLGLTTEHLNGAVVALTGLTTLEWMDAYVMLAARELLSQPQPTIGEVGRMLGFNTIQVFSRYFKQRQKLTPWQYRGMVIRGSTRVYSGM